MHDASSVRFCGGFFVRFLFKSILNVPVNIFSVMPGWVFLVCTSTKQRKKCIVQGSNLQPLDLETSTIPLSQPLLPGFVDFCKFCRPRMMLTTFSSNLDPKRWDRSGYKLFDTLMIFLKDDFKKVDLKKISRR